MFRPDRGPKRMEQDYIKEKSVTGKVQCSRCQQQAVTGFKHQGPLCRGCFIDEIEHRIRKHLREARLIKANATYLTAERLIRKTAQPVIRVPMKVKLVTKSAVQEAQDKGQAGIRAFLRHHKAAAILLPWTLDDEAAAGLEMLFHETRKTTVLQGRSPLQIAYFRAVLKAEVREYARIKRILFRSPYDSAMDRPRDIISQRLPSAIFGFVRSMDGIARLRQKDPTSKERLPRNGQQI